MEPTTVEKWKESLGCKVKDAVTGFEGILFSRAVSLYGGYTCLIMPTVDSSGRLPDPVWFEESRIIFYEPIKEDG